MKERIKDQITKLDNLTIFPIVKDRKYDTIDFDNKHKASIFFKTDITFRNMKKLLIKKYKITTNFIIVDHGGDYIE
jgi:hypothetical protein